MGYLVHHFLSESAQRDPDAIAFRHRTESVTYGELEARSNQLAHALRGSGVVPGDRVGIHLGKSRDAIVGVFGVMKAGGCYVPVDINSPGRRLSSIARQCEMKSLITSFSAAGKLSEFGAELPLQSIFLADGVFEGGLDVPARIYQFREAIALHRVEPPDHKGTDHALPYLLLPSESTVHPTPSSLSHLTPLPFST